MPEVELEPMLIVKLELHPNTNPITSQVTIDPVLNIQKVIREHAPDLYTLVVMPSQNHAPLFKRLTIDSQASEEERRKGVETILNVIRIGLESKYNLTK